MRSLSLLRAACAIPASFGLAVSLYAAGTDAGQLAEAMWQTSCANHGWVRERLMERMQPYADSCTHTMWFEHCDAAPGSDLRSGEDGTIFQFYQSALDKVLDEVAHTSVDYGSVALWHLYNMGYVVKTPSHTFGIDIKHRDAAMLAPVLEFLCITHNLSLIHI